MGIFFVFMIVALAAVVVASIWSFRAWGPAVGIPVAVGLGAIVWWVPFGWVVGLVAGFVLIPIAQRERFRKIAEDPTRMSVAPPAGGEGAAAPLPEGTVRCSRCGRPVPAAQAAFDEQGGKLCGTCDVADQADSGTRKALQTVRSGAYGAPAVALCSLFFNPFWMFTIMSVGAGFGALLYLARNPEQANLMSPLQKLAMQVCGAIGGLGGIAVGVLHLYVLSK